MFETTHEHFFLTSVASYDSVLPERDCPVCGSLQFKGYPLRVESKCRRCKTMLLFEGDRVTTKIHAF